MICMLKMHQKLEDPVPHKYEHEQNHILRTKIEHKKGPCLLRQVLMVYLFSFLTYNHFFIESLIFFNLFKSIFYYTNSV